MNILNQRLPVSEYRHEFNKYLRSLDEMATHHNPTEKPLLVENRYYSKVENLEQYLFQVYYAYYGYGKTYGIGLKLYHESLNGELKGRFDVILLNLRNILSATSNTDNRFSCHDFVKTINKLRGTEPHLALIATSLYLGASRFCGPDKCPYCYSTIRSRNSNKYSELPPFTGHEKVNEEFIDMLVRKISDINNTHIILVFDEFESVVGTVAPQQLDAFLYDIGSLLRRLYDRGNKRLSIVVLLQKAIFAEAQRRSFENMLREGSPIRGITTMEEIKSYPSHVYSSYVIEAILRIDKKYGTRFFNYLETALRLSKRSKRRSYEFRRSIDEKKRGLRKEFDKIFVRLEKLPPRVAFPLVRKYTVNLLSELAFYIKMVDEQGNNVRAPEVRNMFEAVFKKIFEDESETFGIFPRLYMELGSGKNLFANELIKSSLNEMISTLLNELYGCDLHSISSYRISGFNISLCVKNVREKGQPLMQIKLGILKPNELNKNVAPSKVIDRISSIIVDKVYRYIALASENGDNPTVELDGIVITSNRVDSNIVKMIVRRAVEKTRKDIEQFMGLEARVSSDVYIRRLENEDIIILYYMYKKRRREELVNEDDILIKYLDERARFFIEEIKFSRGL